MSVFRYAITDIKITRLKDQLNLKLQFIGNFFLVTFFFILFYLVFIFSPVYNIVYAARKLWWAQCLVFTYYLAMGRGHNAFYNTPDASRISCDLLTYLFWFPYCFPFLFSQYLFSAVQITLPAAQQTNTKLNVKGLEWTRPGHILNDVVINI